MRSNSEDQKLYNPIIERGLRLRTAIVLGPATLALDEDMPPCIIVETGAATTAINLPAAQTGAGVTLQSRAGLTFWIINNTAGTIAVQTSGGAAFATAITLLTLEAVQVICTGHATPNLGWRAGATATSA